MIEIIPHVLFDSEKSEHLGLDIVLIEKIAAEKERYPNHHPEVPHQLKFYNLIYFTEGKGRHFIDFNWVNVQQNTLIYLTKEQIHAFDFSGNLKGYCIIFTEQYFINCFSNLTKDFIFRLFNPQIFSPLLQIPDNSDFNFYFKLLQKEFANKASFNYKTILESLFVILISKAENIKQYQTNYLKDSSKTQTFQKFTLCIAQYATTSRSALFYADKLAITYKHLNTICKELVNKTAKNVIDDFVILQAKRNLINSNIKSTQLAYKLGFEDPTNFTKYFKKITGLTPNSFVKAIKKV